MIKREVILEEFKKFMDEPIPEAMDGYGIDHARIIGQAFVIVIKPKGLVSLDSVSLEDVYTFPIVKVLNVGDGWDGPSVDVGDYVRISDHYGLKIYNPAYEVMINNEYNKSNLNQVNPNPPKFIMNLWAALRQKLFRPDFLEMDQATWKKDVFFFDSGNVVCKIDNVETFLK